MSILVYKTAPSIVLCPVQLRDDINENPDIIVHCISVTVDNEVELTLEFATNLSSEENGELDTLIEDFVCETAVGGGELPDTGSGLVISHDAIPLVMDVQTVDFTGCVAVEQPDDQIPLARTHIGSKRVKNETGLTIPAFSPVYVIGMDSTGDPTVGLASNGNAAKMPAVGLTHGTILNGETGLVTVSGELVNLNTSSFAVGDNLYVGPNGTIINVRPSGASNLVQKIAQVIKSDVTSGAVLVFGAGRTNDVPNITVGKVWMGDSSGVATETDVFTEGEITTKLAQFYTQTEINLLFSGLDDDYVNVTGDTMTGSLTMSSDAKIKLTDGTQSAPGLTFATNVGTGIWLEPNGDMAFSVDGQEIFEIETTGRVRISGNTPNYETLVTHDDVIPNKKYVDDNLASAISNHDHELNDLTNVSGTPSTSDVLTYTGTGWEPQEPSSGSGGGLVGTLYTLVFVYETSNVKNRWLSHYGDNSNHSYNIPAVCPWASELVGITFSNKDNDADTRIKIYTSVEGNGKNDSQKYDWTLYDVRTARNTSMTNVLFDAGEKVAVYLQDVGNDPDYPVVTLYMKVTNDTPGTNIETWSGSF